MSLSQPIGTNLEAVPQYIVWVASAVQSMTLFQERARLVAQELNPEVIETLVTFFHKPPPKPTELGKDFAGLGQWMAVCQAAIFEIFYNYRELALPILYRIAFGLYDWTQASAIQVLCRLGREGVAAEQSGEEFGAALPTWRYEAIIYALPDLAAFAVVSPPLLTALHNLIREWQEGDPIDAFEVIWQLSDLAPATVQEYTPFLRGLLRGHGLENRSPLLDGKVVQLKGDGEKGTVAAVSGPSYPTVADYHSIRAAIALIRILPKDEEAFRALKHWVNEHPDPNVRQEIAEILSKYEG